MSPSELVFIGVVQVPLACLQFRTRVGERLFNRQHCKRLERLFRATWTDHSNPLHWVDAYVDNSEIAVLWTKLGLAQWQLKKTNADGHYPVLANQSVTYTQGRHKIQAARNIDPTSNWTIRLFGTNLAEVSLNQAIKRRTEQYLHERPNTDGHIYSKLRGYESSRSDFHEWYERLSRTKQVAFRSIGQRSAIQKALDKLMEFPAIIDDLLLSSFLKYIDFRLDDELSAGLAHVYKSWSRLTCDNEFIQRVLNKETVEMLEGRAPGLSQSDRQWTRLMFDSGKAFQGVDDPLQVLEIQRRVETTFSIIPGLVSLQQHMLFLEVAAEIIWSHVLSTDLRKEAKRHHRSLRSTLRRCWTETVPYLEVREGEFQPALGPPCFALAYNQLILAALRQFPFLTHWKPKGERSDAAFLSVDPDCVSLFHRRAKLLGFRTAHIERGAAVLSAPFIERSHPGELEADAFDEAGVFSSIARRWGRPCLSIFRVMQTKAFLPTISSVGNYSEMNVIIILRDFLQTFFEPCVVEYDLTRSKVSINDVSGTHQRVVPLMLGESSYSQPGAGAFRTMNEEVYHSSDSHHTVTPIHPEAQPLQIQPGSPLREDDISMRDYDAALRESRVRSSVQRPRSSRVREWLDTCAEDVGNEDIAPPTASLSGNTIIGRSPTRNLAYENRRLDRVNGHWDKGSLRHHTIQGMKARRISAKRTQRLPNSSSSGSGCTIPTTANSIVDLASHPPHTNPTERYQGSTPVPKGQHTIPGRKSANDSSNASNEPAAEGSSAYEASFNGAADRSSSSPDFRLGSVSLPVMSSPDTLLHSEAAIQAERNCLTPCASVSAGSRMSRREPPDASGPIPQQPSPNAGLQQPGKLQTYDRHSRRHLAQSTTDMAEHDGPTNRSTLAPSPVRPRSEIRAVWPHSAPFGVAKQTPGTVDHHSIPPQSHSRAVSTVNSVRPRSEVPVAQPFSTSGPVTRRSGSDQPDGRPQLNRGTSSGMSTPSEAPSTALCWSWSQPSSRSTPPRSTKRWRIPPDYPRNVPEYLRRLSSTEPYGQMSGTQGFEDSEDDFMTVNLYD